MSDRAVEVHICQKRWRTSALATHSDHNMGRQIKTLIEAIVQEQLSGSQLLSHTELHRSVRAGSCHLLGCWGQQGRDLCSGAIDTSKATCLRGGVRLLDLHKTNDSIRFLTGCKMSCGTQHKSPHRHVVYSEIGQERRHLCLSKAFIQKPKVSVVCIAHAMAEGRMNGQTTSLTLRCCVFWMAVECDGAQGPLVRERQACIFVG